MYDMNPLHWENKNIGLGKILNLLTENWWHQLGYPLPLSYCKWQSDLESPVILGNVLVCFCESYLDDEAVYKMMMFSIYDS